MARRVPSVPHGTPVAAASLGTAPGAGSSLGESIVIPTRVVVIIIVITCYVGGFVSLLHAGNDPLGTVSVLYLASGAATDLIRRVLGMAHRP